MFDLKFEILMRTLELPGMGTAHTPPVTPMNANPQKQNVSR